MRETTLKVVVLALMVAVMMQFNQTARCRDDLIDIERQIVMVHDIIQLHLRMERLKTLNGRN